MVGMVEMRTRAPWTLLVIAGLLAACDARNPSPQAPPGENATAAAPAPRPVRSRIPTGDLEYKAEGGDGRITLEAIDVGRYRVAIQVVAPDCGGQILGLGTREGEGLAFVSTPEPGAPATCRANITFKDGKPHVQEGEGCSFYHGFSCSFSSAPE